MRGKDLFEKITDIDDNIIAENESVKTLKKPVYLKWVAAVACLTLILTAIPLTSHFINTPKKDPSLIEVVIELNNKLYSVVDNKKSPAYANYNLENKITSDMLGDYLGEAKTYVDNKGDIDTFKLYRYNNCPVTQYDWYPRLIVENSKGEYYHALIGSIFSAKKQTAQEVLAVYGLSSSKDIVSIQNQKGNKIADRGFIEEFYNGLFTREYGDNDFFQKNVYPRYVNDTIYLKVELSNRLIITVGFANHNYVNVDHGLYFKVDEGWLDLVSIFK